MIHTAGLPPQPTAATELIVALQSVLLALMIMMALLADDLGTGAVICQSTLFILVAAIPVLAEPSAAMSGRRITLALALAFYSLNFGVRAVYLCIAPDVVLYPSFSPESDLAPLIHGQVWCAFGVAGLTWGYLNSERLLHRRTGPGLLVRSTIILRSFSSTTGLVIIYTIGTLARIRTIQTGASLWIYNSPSFDLFAERSDGSASGLLSLLSDLPLIALAAGVVNHLSHRLRTAYTITPIVLAGGVVLEISFQTYSLYKFGLLAIALVLAIANAHIGAPRWRQLILVSIGIVVVVIPFVNVARDTLLPYYTSNTRSVRTWLYLADEARRQTVAEASVTGTQGTVDAFMIRLNGAESLAVATKYGDTVPIQQGRTYMNLLWQAVPGVVRPADWTPYYIEWAAEFVGLETTNLTVIPMPAVVEAFLNFGWVGPPLVLGMLGAALAYFDHVGTTRAIPSLGVALAAYSATKLLNIEHYMFITVVPVMKIWMLVVACALSKTLFRLGPSAAL